MGVSWEEAQRDLIRALVLLDYSGSSSELLGAVDRKKYGLYILFCLEFGFYLSDSKYELE
jgi:hypothetical protein